MRKIVILSILLLAATAFAARSEVVSFTNNWGKNPMFNIASKSDAGMEIVFSIHKMVVDEMQIDGVPMKTYGIPGIFLPNNEGAPNLYGTGRYIAIPQGATAKASIIDVRTEVYHNIEIAPAPNIPSDNDDSPQRYVKDMSIYGKNAYYPESPVKVSEPMQMRGVDCVILGITPFQYNPVTKELIVYKDIRVRVDFIGGNGHFGDDALRSIYWEPILQGNLLNYSSLPQIDFFASSRTKARDGYEYIIIVPDDPIFQAWGDTIKKWRTLQGISTQVFTLTQVGGNTSTAIETFLNNAYNTWSPRPVAFLLLSDYPSSGDVYGITSPTYTYAGETVVSDNIYADVDGDNLPDMLQARICAQNASQLSIMINKFLSNERTPPTAANFYNQPLVCCAWSSASGDARWFQLCGEVIRGFFINNLGKNPARQYQIYNGTPTVGGAWSSATNTQTVVNYFSNLGYIPTTNQHDATWWSNGSAAGISAAINSGAFLVQHRDHGYVQGWGEPAYSSTDVAGLINNKYTWVNSTNCQTGEYNYSTPCFVETFHRSQYGALGANAPSEVSFSFVNDVYIWGWYDCMWQRFMPDYPAADITPYGTLLPSAAMVYGKYFLHSSSWPYIPEYDNLTFHLFHHFGDAFNALYTEMPQNLTVVHMPTMIAGTSTFTVSANDSSVIALTANGEILGAARGTGNPVSITITPQIPGTNVIVTVTKPNYYRYQTTVPVVSLSTLVLPNGGEIWPGGTNQQIKWRTVGIGFDRYRLLLSRNSGSTYTDTIAHNVAPTETTYNWLVPLLNLNTCRVKVQMLDTSGSVISQDGSDGNFTIQTAVTVVSPNGGEIWSGGTNQQIKWRTVGFARYRILLSRNGGSTYTDTIAYNVIPTETTYNWLVPFLNLNTCRVMVQMLDAGDSVIVQDVSDANFTIDSDAPSAFSLIAPPNGAWASEFPTFVWHRSIDNFALAYYQLSITIPNDTIEITNITDTTYTSSFINWTQATANAAWSARVAYTSVVFDNKIWVMGGYDNSFRNDVWYSTDGINWTQATANAAWSARYSHTSVIFDNKMWVIGGYDASGRRNDVWYSTDGVTWTQVTSNAGWSARYLHTSVVFDNKMWVIGGYDASGRRNDVWYSTDGVTWTQATSNAAWSVRWEQTSVVFDNKMWVMGGFNASGRSNDVWYSTDGINWTQATANAGWSARYLHASAVFDNKMWVMGGYDNSFRNDVWYSTDGINWTQATPSAGWSARDNYTLVVFDNKMWVMGGEDVSGKRNDVWYSLLIPPFLPEGLRTWWVTAFDRAGNRRRSTQVYSVKIDSTPPMAFNLLLPADSIWSTGTDLTYSWQASSDAGVGLLKYQLWMNDVLNRDNIPPTQTSTTHTGTLGTGTYTWQIRAIDSVGNTRLSNQTRVLRVDVTLPNAFSLVSPSNYSWTQQRRPRFIWRATSDIGIGLRIYQLYINGVLRDSIQPPDTSLVSPITLSDGSNSWYVRAIDGLGNGTNTSTWYMNVDSTPPTSFNLVSPPDSGLRNIPTPNLTWRKSTDAGIGFKKYELWIDNVRNIDSLGQNDTVATPYNPLSEGYYTWFVKAFDRLDNVSNSNQIFTVILDWNLPDTFSLSFPYDNDTTNSLQPTLYWHPSYDIGSGVRRYQLWINGLLNRDSIPPSDTFTIPINPLANNTSNTWFIKAIDLAGGTRSSNQTWRFVTSDLIPPTVPILISPSNNGYINDSLPKFWWHKSTDISGIDYYQLQYAMDSNFTGAVTVNVSDTSYQVPNRLNDTIYYWRVKSVDRTGNQSNWTSTWTFEVDTRIPLTPTLLAPLNGTWQNISNVIFRWTLVTFDKMMKPPDILNLNLEKNRDLKVDYSTEVLSPIRYIMQVDTNRNFTTPLFTDTTNLTQDTLNIGERRKCYWRVRGYDLSGNQGVFSNIDSFRVDLTPPSTPQLVTPDSGLIINTQTVNFIWHRSTDNLSGVQYYILQYATTYLFLNPVTVDSITDTTCVSLPLGDSIYYWRVSSKDFAGNTSSWSLIRSFRVDNTLPLVPTLVAPANGYITNNSNVTFIWQRSTSSDISFYTLQYCRNLSFSEVDSVARIDTFYTTTLTDTTYYWRIRAVDSASNRSVWSSVWSFEVDTRIPNTPALVSPLNGIWFTNTSIIFNWGQVTFDAKSQVRYILQADTSRNFTNPSIDTTGLLYDTLVLNRARYFWRVKAYDLAGNQGAFSGRDSFGIDNTAPSVPNLISPANGVMTNNANVTFIWNRSTDNLSGVLRYTLQCAIDPGFILSRDTIVTDTTFTITLIDTTYYWRVKSHDRAGNQSNYSTTRSFELDTRIPNAPTLVSPVNGVWSINTSITFSWSQVTFNAKSPIRYILQVDASVNFTNPITDTTSFVYDTLTLTQARYYWRVRAYDLAGNQGTFSGHDSFGIDYTAPSVPNLVSPVNGAILTDSFVTFIWNRSTDNVSGVRNYQIQIANNFGLNNPFDTTLTDTTYLRRLSDTTYYWRVKSIDYANNQSPWSSVRNFRVQTTGIEEILDATKLLIFSLGQNSPNPFSRLTEIRYGIPYTSKINIAIFSSTGEEIIKLVNNTQNQGWYSVRWNGKDKNGKECSAGVYFVSMKTENYKSIKKVLIAK